jgi:hypothetical protein
MQGCKCAAAVKAAFAINSEWRVTFLAFFLAFFSAGVSAGAAAAAAAATAARACSCFSASCAAFFASA